VLDLASLEDRDAAGVERNAIAEVTLRARRVLALDDYARSPATGRFVLFDGYDIVGGGTIATAAYPDQRAVMITRATNIVPVDHTVSRADRRAAAGHDSGVLWFTGLSGAGKTTLALALEQRLFERGYLVYVLDGDNVRNGLNADLGFSPGDRAENIRRIGEVAALFADAGFIVITSFISPYRAERERARFAVGDSFHEIYIAADLATCERRDPKGLYRKARAGAIENFTGISAPYEPPEAAELVLDTTKAPVEHCLARLIDYIDTRFALTRRRGAGKR
jgi:bifunctional enzyme CysN/CysC